MDLPAPGLSLPAVLETARLVLRRPVPGDLAAIVAGVSDLEVARWLSPVPHPYAEEDGRAFLAESAVRPGVWIVTEGGKVVGLVSTREELGYWVARAHWGRGIATEAARAAARAWFAAGPAMLLSSHMEGNEASRRVLLKLGFEDAGPRVIASRALGQEVPGRAMRLGRAP